MTYNCFIYAKREHKVRDCPNVKCQDKGSGIDKSSCFNLDSIKKNFFYELRSRGEHEMSSDLLSSILHVFSIDVYVLLDPGATL